ncbi:MAG: glutamine-hydrolyzing GMP synthase [Flavobacteriaceae bacterium]|nr:glutamine-hydrolyzing GMP synthase [Flavobacteriaceae bacterium]MBL6684494.1 glutamine-hydrolyzing GMP synthase [Flavobacteriaceae bacterium]
MQEKVLILDFGSQYTQLIARRVRELNIYCEIFPFNNNKYKISDYKALILSGSPYSVRSEDSLKINIDNIRGVLPILGICYGAQLLAHNSGGVVKASKTREYGRANLQSIDNTNNLFSNIQNSSQVWMSHADTIFKLPLSTKRIASTKDVENAAFQFIDENTFGIQFHPEVYHSSDGKTLLKNFLVDIANIKPNWTASSFVDKTIHELKNIIGDESVVLGLSGGVDSSVAAVLLNKAIGNNLYCVFIDNGLLRKNEFDSVLKQYEGMGLNVKGVDAKDKFYSALKNIDDPEKKRKVIGKVFVDVFDEESKKINNVKWLGQGTIYPDVIESISVKGPSATIKSHHNVGGLPDYMKLKVIEPLKMLFKDEVRRVGKELKISDNILKRHPFPGPGLAIRILGDINEEKVKILQDADEIFITELISNNLYDKIWQAGVILLPIKSVGVMGDERTYENCVVLRAVTSTDGMTADWVNLPYKFLQDVSNKIINNVKGINRVVYDISSKPPATIEWE